MTSFGAFLFFNNPCDHTLSQRGVFKTRHRYSGSRNARWSGLWGPSAPSRFCWVPGVAAVVAAASTLALAPAMRNPSCWTLRDKGDLVVVSEAKITSRAVLVSLPVALGCTWRLLRKYLGLAILLSAIPVIIQVPF